MCGMCQRSETSSVAVTSHEARDHRHRRCAGPRQQGRRDEQGQPGRPLRSRIRSRRHQPRAGPSDHAQMVSSRRTVSSSTDASSRHRSPSAPIGLSQVRSAATRRSWPGARARRPPRSVTRTNTLRPSWALGTRSTSPSLLHGRDEPGHRRRRDVLRPGERAERQGAAAAEHRQRRQACRREVQRGVLARQAPDAGGSPPCSDAWRAAPGPPGRPAGGACGPRRPSPPCGASGVPSRVPSTSCPRATCSCRYERSSRHCRLVGPGPAVSRCAGRPRADGPERLVRECRIQLQAGDLCMAGHHIADVLHEQHDEAGLAIDADLQPAVGSVGEHVRRPRVVRAQHERLATLDHRRGDQGDRSGQQHVADVAVGVDERIRRASRPAGGSAARTPGRSAAGPVAWHPRRARRTGRTLARSLRAS